MAMYTLTLPLYKIVTKEFLFFKWYFYLIKKKKKFKKHPHIATILYSHV